jgi:hypothetical protein
MLPASLSPAGVITRATSPPLGISGRDYIAI